MSLQGRVLAGMLAVTALGADAAAQTAINADSLKRRSPIVNSSLVALYESPEYREAYAAAQEHYRRCGVGAWTPAKWQTYKQYQWLTATQGDVSAWMADVDGLGKRLERLASDPQIEADPKKMAQIREIEDDFSADSIRSLNRLVEALPLSDLFRYNHLPDFEKDWFVRQVPTDRNTGLMEFVSDFAHRVNAALSATRGALVHFKATAKFATYADYLLDERGDPIRKPEPYYIFWQNGSMNQQGTVAPVQKTMVELHAYLARAEGTIAQEGLLALPADKTCKAVEGPREQPMPVAHVP